MYQYGVYGFVMLQVDTLRGELKLLTARSAVRDEQLLKHVKEVEAQQIGAVTAQLTSSRAEVAALTCSYAALRDTFASIHHALSPQPLAAAFGYRCAQRPEHAMTRCV